MHRELRAGGFEKETEAALVSGVQSMIFGTLGNSQVFRDLSPLGSNSDHVSVSFLISFLTLGKSPTPCLVLSMTVLFCVSILSPLKKGMPHTMSASYFLVL